MGDLKIDASSGDLDVSNNTMYITDEGLPSIAQRLRIRLRFFFREWVLDRSVGTKWFELVLRKDVDIFLADQEIRQIVEDTPQIKSISSWDSSIDSFSREYSVVATVHTNLGQQLTFGFSDIQNTNLNI